MPEWVWPEEAVAPIRQKEQRWRCAATEGDSGPPRLLKWEVGGPRSGASRHGERGFMSQGL